MIDKYVCNYSLRVISAHLSDLHFHHESVCSVWSSFSPHQRSSGRVCGGCERLQPHCPMDAAGDCWRLRPGRIHHRVLQGWKWVVCERLWGRTCPQSVRGQIVGSGPYTAGRISPAVTGSPDTTFRSARLLRWRHVLLGSIMGAKGSFLRAGCL